MSPLSFHTNLQADWCNDRSQRAKTHSGTPAKQQSATKSVILRKSILFFFYSKLGSFWYGSPRRTLQIYTGGFSSARFTVCQPKNAAFCSTGVFQQCFATSLLVSNIHIRATSLSKSYLKEIWWLQGSRFKAHPVGNITDQIKRSWCLPERCLGSVSTQPPLCKQPEAISTHFPHWKANRLGCLHSNTSKRMAH